MEQLAECIEAIRKEQNGEGGYVSDSTGNFNYIGGCVAFDGDSPESDNLDFVVENGYLDLLGFELRADPLRSDTLYAALVPSTTIFLSERNAAKIANNGVVADLAKFVKKYAPDPVAALALTAITNLALHSVSHKSLRENDILPMAVSLLRFLPSEVVHELDFGLTSASLICRLAGYEESGPGPESIRSNSKLIERMTWLIRSVLDAGPHGTVIGYTWNPANIMYDISVLALSDRNKPLLVDFVELVTRAIEERMSNKRMVRFAIIALSQLYFEPKCRAEFDRLKPRILTALDKVIQESVESDNETWRSATIFKASLEEKPRQRGASTSAPKLRGVVGKLRSLGATQAAAKANPNANKHVMISYQWDSQPYAKALNEHLIKSGLKTWFDLTDMGPNINDSMAFAVENAYAIVVLFSRKYKESSNCRKECEMGDGLSKPLVFVKVDPEYKQEGWLNLVMGKALWIDANQADGLSQVVKRVAQAGSVTATEPAITTPAPLPTPSTPTSPSSGSSSSDLKEIQSMLKTMMQQFTEMQTEVKGLRADVNALRQEVKKQ